MRKIILVAAIVLVGETAHAQGLTNLQVTQAAPAPQAAPEPQAVPAQAAPAAQAAPDAATQPIAKPSKPAKNRQAKRRETDEEKARRIAAKYGVTW
jgi:hypothetical protein